MAYPVAATIQTSVTDSDNGLDVTMPSGIASGDLLIVGFTCASGDTVTVPSGWSVVRNDGNFRSYRRTAGGSEPASYRWGTNNTRSYSAVAVRITGADATDPIPASSGQGSGGSTSPTAPTLTTPANEFLLLWFAGWRRAQPNTASCTPPGGMTEIAEVTATAGSVNNAGTCLATEQFATAGATGSRVGTLSASVGNVGQMLAIRPATTPPAPTTPQPTEPDRRALRALVLREQRSSRRRSAPRAEMATGAGAGTGAGLAYGDLPTVTVSAPTAVASAGGAGNASGDLPTVTVTAPDASASAGAAVDGALPTVTVSAPTATASGGAEGNAIGALPTVTVTAPDASATGAAAASGALPTILITALAGTADGGAPTTGTGWTARIRVAGYRWRLAWRPMSSPAAFPVPVSPGNDGGVIVDSVTGWQLPTGAPIAYGGATITAYWASTPESTTALGSVTLVAPRNASPPAFAVGFDATQITTALGALADGTPVWLVLEGVDEFRLAIEHVVRRARTAP